ncbi:protein YhfH [Sporosarcina sp. G11-34]|nr:protein YhfH [Sporosarcina sp. G11-34]MCZ2257605.1 YhfH family protein [Sporosarcina sp. G11-34]
MREKEMTRRSPEKECRECGNKIVEKHESYLYECERCIGKHEA